MFLYWNFVYMRIISSWQVGTLVFRKDFRRTKRNGGKMDAKRLGPVK